MKKLSVNLKKLRDLNSKRDIDLWSLDEVHFQQHGSRCTMWVPPEDLDPVVLHEPTSKHVSVFGAVSIKKGCLITSLAETFNGATFQKYLEQLLGYKIRERCMHVILDNSRYHHAKILQPWLEKHSEEIRLEFLPSYSPKLNPIERIWKLTRKLCTHNRYFPNLEELIEAITTQFKQWQKPNPVLQRLCKIN